VLLMLSTQGWCAEGAVPSKRFVDCSDCPRMIALSAGHFDMGVAPGEEDREQLAEYFRGRSEPRRTVHVAPFAIGMHEVTREQYARFVAATGYRSEGCFVWSGDAFVERRERNWRDPGLPQDERHPVVCVSWNDAQAYVRWLSERAGVRYRLPSEAEWEYAARGGQRNQPYPWGAAVSRDKANYGADNGGAAAAEGADKWLGTAPVASFPLNGYGLYDMAGNVWEWTADWYAADAYAGGPAKDPTGPATGTDKVLRGGAWDNPARALRSSDRNHFHPASVNPWAGMRCVVDELPAK
jgi:sulfatase modifying factor 1